MCTDQSQDYITLKQYLQGRADPPSPYTQLYTSRFESSAKELLSRVNPFLEELGALPVTVTSGWRPYPYNKKIGGAPNSYHVVCMAVDLLDDSNGTLDALILKNFPLLTKYGLWVESPGSTPRWVHLDIGDRPDRNVRVFLP